MSEPTGKTHVKLRGGVGEDALRQSSAPPGPRRRNQEGKQPMLGLKAKLRTFCRDVVYGREIDSPAYDTMEKFLPLLLALVAIGIKLWLYW